MTTKFTIIEDCSPYYIRFTHDGINTVIQECIDAIRDVKFIKGFTHHILSAELANAVLNATPLSKIFELKKYRVSLFVTNPGYYYSAHKDGPDCRVSLNYTVSILDDKCVTSWYSDADLAEYKLDPRYINSREVEGFDKSNHIPTCSMTAKPNEFVLFNTELYHDFDNSNSTNQRIVLTLRLKNASATYFDDAKAVLLNQT